MKKLLSLLLAICLLSTALCLPASAATQFSDIKGNEWYAPAVAYCADNGYMSGTGNNKFDPNGKVSRAQMAQILYNFAGRPDMTNAENPFTDVKRDAWYGSAVLFAKTTGIVNGTSSTTYSPNNYITREQVAVMLFGYYKASTGTTPSVDKSILNSYTDKNMISSWAQDAIAWAIQNKIMSGTGNNKLDPKGTCTRAQLAQFIMNYCKAFGTPPPIKPDIPVDDIVKELIGDTKPLPEDWLPKGGYIQGDRKYNMYGIDVTEVDGIPDREEARLINMINDYREENGLPRIQWNQHAQILAEVRAAEGAYIYGNKLGSAHNRPDGSATNQCESEIGFANLSTGNYFFIEELGITEEMIDANKVASGKTINQGKLTRDHFITENAFTGIAEAEGPLNGWKESPGHNNAMLDDMTRWGENAYAACARAKDPITGGTCFMYDAYAVNWIAKQSGEILTDIPVNNASEWEPNSRINWDNLGFTLNDIPEDSSSHDLTVWLAGQNIQNGDKLFAPLYGAWFYERSLDNVIRDMFEDYYMLENRNPSKDDLLNLTYEDMSMVKHMCVTSIGDKLVNGHISLTDGLNDNCKVCGVQHNSCYDEGRDYIDQWFMDTYGIDVSGIGNANKPCTNKATGERFDAYSDEWFNTTWMPWQEWLESYSQDF